MAQSGSAGGESIVGLAKQLVGGLVGLAKIEVRHGRQEIGAMLATTKGGAIRLGIAAVFGLLLLIALVAFIVLGISALTGLPGWLIALIAAILFAALALLFGVMGAKRIRIGAPEETITSVKEDISWAKRLLRRD